MRPQGLKYVRLLAWQDFESPRPSHRLMVPKQYITFVLQENDWSSLRWYLKGSLSQQKETFFPPTSKPWFVSSSQERISCRELTNWPILPKRKSQNQQLDKLRHGYPHFPVTLLCSPNFFHLHIVCEPKILPLMRNFVHLLNVWI